MLRRLFLDHPQSVGETYLEHQRKAFGFGAKMLAGSMACFVHGLVPALFLRTASSAIQVLYERLVVGRGERVSRPTAAPRQ